MLSGDVQYLPVLNELVPPDRWSAMREELIEESQRSDRHGYRRLARSIREYRQVAGKAPAHDLRDRILEEFPRRPAMRDELSRV